ncbi:MAG: hypothetical protein K1060chlam1_01126 [Candidatus Anoxychlamydiales bacterium]|nr:hypothetical protein [Candidatus Anoxychlamydiales bacterium]
MSTTGTFARVANTNKTFPYDGNNFAFISTSKPNKDGDFGHLDETFLDNLAHLVNSIWHCIATLLAPLFDWKVIEIHDNKGFFHEYVVNNETFSDLENNSLIDEKGRHAIGNGFEITPHQSMTSKKLEIIGEINTLIKKIQPKFPNQKYELITLKKEKTITEYENLLSTLEPKVQSAEERLEELEKGKLAFERFKNNFEEKLKTLQKNVNSTLESIPQVALFIYEQEFAENERQQTQLKSEIQTSETFLEYFRKLEPGKAVLQKELEALQFVIDKEEYEDKSNIPKKHLTRIDELVTILNAINQISRKEVALISKQTELCRLIDESIQLGPKLQEFREIAGEHPVSLDSFDFFDTDSITDILSELNTEFEKCNAQIEKIDSHLQEISTKKEQIGQYFQTLVSAAKNFENLQPIKLSEKPKRLSEQEALDSMLDNLMQKYEEDSRRSRSEPNNTITETLGDYRLQASKANAVLSNAALRSG